MTVVVGVCSFASQSNAVSSGVIATANLFTYELTTTDDPGISSTSKTSLYDIKLGYLSPSGLYLGALYTSRNTTEILSETGKALGASVGYFGTNGFFLKGHYLLSAERGYYKKGSGLQAEVGYLTHISDAFIVGVELTHRSITYTENEWIPLLDNRKETELFPLLTIGFVI